MTAIEALDRELERLHNELSTFTEMVSEYDDVLREISRVNGVLSEVVRKEHNIES